MSDNGMMAVILGYQQGPPKTIVQSLTTLANKNSQTTLALKGTSIYFEKNNIQQHFQNVQRWKNKKFS